MAWFSITDTEFIQAVQTRQHSVPLIEQKPTYLRVSVRGGVPMKVTGRLSARALEIRGGWQGSARKLT
ncbi:MAG: hypothetical protein JNN08_04370 [Bryobacterales bacterium]|nr:hypothetical protein [Bryobacterales bacterium]